MSEISSHQDPALSVLKLEHLVFDHISFTREGLPTKDDSSVRLEIQAHVDALETGRYCVSLSVTAIKKEEYTAVVEASAFCAVDEGYTQRDDLLKKNAVAILLPFVRAQLTLLTAQPEMDPIVLPAFNVNALLEKDRTVLDPDGGKT